jgi:ubiquitin-protein ligase
MGESPRTRRLRSDFEELKELTSESTILRVWGRRSYPNAPPDQYRLVYHGNGIESVRAGEPCFRKEHEVAVVLGPDYPRLPPEITWRTPIFHPNVASCGAVCLGPLRQHWTPGVRLVDLCRLLWDILRYANFDAEVPLNAEAANWVRSQPPVRFPLDTRPLRDRLSGRPDDRLSVVGMYGVPQPPPLPHTEMPGSDVLIID